MMDSNKPSVIVVSRRAAEEMERQRGERLKQIAADENTHATAGLRVSVQPGGCSGFRYALEIDPKPADDDLVMVCEGVRIFIDPFSLQYLNGVEIDYVTTMQQSGFTFRNPNASGGCGCGSSFSTE